MSIDRWFLYLWLAAVLAVGVCYFTHPARTTNTLKSLDHWRAIVNEIAGDK
jgi:hypothetical protein